MKETDFFLIVIVLTPLLIILFLFLLKEVVSYIFRVPEEYKRQKKKEQLGKQGDKIEEQFTSQFSPENSSDYEQWMKTFALENPVIPFSSIPEDVKRKIILECICIEGLKEEDKSFVAKTLYDITVEGNAPLIKRLRDFLFEKLNLKYKYLAEKSVRFLIKEVYYQFHRTEVLYDLEDEK